MTAAAANWVWANSRAANGSLIVLLAIADEYKNGGEVEMSVMELGRKTRLSDRAVRCAVKDLERLGELSVTPRKGGASRYALRVTPADSAGPPRQILPDPPTPADSAPRQILPDPPEKPQVRTTPAESAGPEISDVLISTTGSCKVEVKEEPAKSAKPPRPDVDRLCEHLAARIEANGSKRPNIGKRWKDAARLMLDNDGRTEQQVMTAIDWCQDHEFWRSNIMSMPKLREKYDRLRLQAQREMKPAARQNPDDDYANALKRIQARKENGNDTGRNGNDSPVRKVSLPPAAGRRHHLRDVAPRHRQPGIYRRAECRHLHRSFGALLLGR